MQLHGRVDSHLTPSISLPSLPSLNRSPTITHASKGPCLAFIVVILEMRRVMADKGDPIARLLEEGNVERKEKGNKSACVLE